MNFHIISIFPEMFDSYTKESILGRAIKNKLIKIKFINPRKFVSRKYKKVWSDGNISLQIDDKPYGGGPGMVMRAEPLLKAVMKVLSLLAVSMSNLSKDKKKKVLIINFIPNKEKFNTKLAKSFSKSYTDIILICGRYEGIDARVDKILKQYAKGKNIKFKQISIGDYVLTGGELPAMILIDCIGRQVEGVLGRFDSREEERISCSEVYTRPEILKYKPSKAIRNLYKNYRACPTGSTLSFGVPKVLLSGDHKKIEDWKKNRK